MFERFTSRARRAMVLAQEEARLLRHNFIGTEHLMLGVLAEEEGIAAVALHSVGVSLDAAREEVARAIGPSDATVGSPPFTPKAKKVLEDALRESLQLGHKFIGTEHILLGLLRQEDAEGAKAIVRLGVDLADVRKAVVEALATRESTGPAGVLRAASGLPDCPQCGAPLTDSARARPLSVPVDGSPENVDVIVVYCRLCGRAMGLAGPAPSGD